MKYLGETNFSKVEYRNICSYCKYKSNENCNLLINFIENGIDFNSVPYCCPLPDFHFDAYMENRKK